MGVKKAIRYGVARGLFSNEAGMGSTPHAHAIAKVKNPVEQGNVALITVFIDTFCCINFNSSCNFNSKCRRWNFNRNYIDTKIF